MNNTWDFENEVADLLTNPEETIQYRIVRISEIQHGKLPKASEKISESITKIKLLVRPLVLQRTKQGYNCIEGNERLASAIDSGLMKINAFVLETVLQLTAVQGQILAQRKTTKRLTKLEKINLKLHEITGNTSISAKKHTKTFLEEIEMLHAQEPGYLIVKTGQFLQESAIRLGGTLDQTLKKLGDDEIIEKIRKRFTVGATTEIDCKKIDDDDPTVLPSGTALVPVAPLQPIVPQQLRAQVQDLPVILLSCDLPTYDNFSRKQVPIREFIYIQILAIFIFFLMKVEAFKQEIAWEAIPEQEDPTLRLPLLIDVKATPEEERKWPELLPTEVDINQMQLTFDGNKEPLTKQKEPAVVVWWERYDDDDPIFDVAHRHIVARQPAIIVVTQKGIVLEPAAKYPISVEEISFPYPDDIDPTKSIGASRIANVCGFGYSSQLEEYLQMKGDVKPSYQNKKMIFGLIHENAILQTFELTTGRKLTDHQKLFSDKNLRIHCHVDAISVDEVGGTRIVVDAKNSSEFMMNRYNADGSPVWGAHGSDVFPAQYHFQLQQQMLLTGCTRADLAVQFGNADFRVYSVEADPKLQEIIKERAQAFWGYMDDDLPPPAEKHNDVKILYKDQVEKETIELSSAACVALAEKEEIETKIKELQSALESKKMLIEGEIGGAEVGVCPDGRKVTRRADKKGNMRVYYPK